MSKGKVQITFNADDTERAIEPVKTVLTYDMTGGEWKVDPRELAALFAHIADLTDAGMPGSKICGIAFDRNSIVVEIR